MSKSSLVLLALGAAFVASPAPARDTPTPQVLIEARIVEASGGFGREIGIQLGFLPEQARADATMRHAEYNFRRGNYNPDGPIFDPNIQFGGPWLGNLPGFDFDLSILEQHADLQVLMAPKIVALDGREATIFAGESLPFSTQPPSTPPAEFTLQLRVTPQITADDQVLLDFDIVTNLGTLPQIDTRTVQTTVPLPDGGTVVIGGLRRDEDRSESGLVPWLGSIPYLGALFRNQASERNKPQLFVFITARITGEHGGGSGGSSGGSTAGPRTRPHGTRQNPGNRPRVDPNLNQTPNVQY